MSGIHRLEGSRPTAGGLVIKKKKNDDEPVAKVVQGSLLGLDLLAERKEKEKIAFKRPSEESRYVRFAVLKLETKNIVIVVETCGTLFQWW